MKVRFTLKSESFKKDTDILSGGKDIAVTGFVLMAIYMFLVLIDMSAVIPGRFIADIFEKMWPSWPLYAIAAMLVGTIIVCAGYVKAGIALRAHEVYSGPDIIIKNAESIPPDGLRARILFEKETRPYRFYCITIFMVVMIGCIVLR